MTDEQDLTIKSSTGSIQSQADLPDRFNVERVLGQGGMGIVYLASDITLGRTVAIKMLLFEGARNPELLERFEREAKALASLNHANIVKILTWGLSKSGNPFHVMEFLEGQALSCEIGDGKTLTPSQFYTVFQQIFSALAHAHEQMIVHRDLKPSNIFLCKSDSGFSAKLIDFGIVRFQDSQNQSSNTLTATNHLLGSPTYMSPEQCKGQRVDSSSDIYSCACIMYEALTGHPPHQGESSMELMYKHMSADPVRLEALASDSRSRELAKIVDQCLSKDPQLRPRDANEVLHRLETVFENGVGIDDSKPLFQSTKKKGWTGLLKAASIIAVIIICLFAASKIPSSVRKAEKSGSSRTSGPDSGLDRDSSRLEESFREAKNPASKAGYAKALVERLLAIANHKRIRQQDSNGALFELRKAKELCPYADRSGNDYKAMVLMEELICLFNLNEFERAEKTADEGLACNYADIHTSYGLTPEFAKLRAECRFHRRDFDGALKDIQETIDKTYKPLPFEAPSKSGGRVVEISNFIAQEKLETLVDKLAAIQVNNRIVEYLIKEGFVDTSYSASVDNLLRIVAELPKQDPSAKRAASKAYGLAARFLEASDATKYKTMIEKFKRLSARLSS